MKGPPQHDGPSRLISLVMPVWKPRADWLRTAVASALGQRGCEIELVVVDDGCEKPVADVLATIDDKRLRIVRVPHGGASLARNAGLEVARGGRIRFVDSDDVLEPDSTARLAALMGERTDLITYGATLVCDESLRPVWKMACRLQGDVLVDSLLARFMVRLASLLFPRRVVEEAGGWEPGLKVSADWDFILRALEHARVRGERAVATHYRRHSDSITGDISTGRISGELIIGRFFERHPELRGSRLERRAHARLEAMGARVAFTHGRRMEGVARLVALVARDPGPAFDEVRLGLPALVGRIRYLLSHRVG